MAQFNVLQSQNVNKMLRVHSVSAIQSIHGLWTFNQIGLASNGYNQKSV